MLKVRSQIDWNDIYEKLPMREISEEQMPRLLYDATKEIQRLQIQLRDLKSEIQKLWTYAGNS